jgi:hypothetical protein
MSSMLTVTMGYAPPLSGHESLKLRRLTPDEFMASARSP